MNALVAIPVYNEEKCLGGVLAKALAQGHDILVVDDGSTDGTGKVLADFQQVKVVRHPKNRGYGAALRTAFDFAIEHGYDAVVTLDSDGQHCPALIPKFLDEIAAADIVSGSRYLVDFPNDTPAPIERRRINLLVTDQLNASFGLGLSDSFCGFKAYRTSALRGMNLREDGYGMPLELWIQSACLGLKIKEVAVPRIYLDPNRSFGEHLDDANRRIAYYQEVIDRAIEAIRGHEPCRHKDMQAPVLSLIKE